jgi:large subunit ribosomal protein L7/L12
MVDLSKFVNELDALSIDESEELVGILEEKWGVVAAAPTVEFQTIPEEVTVKTEFDVELTSFEPTKKIKVIQAVRGIIGTPLRETKEIIENAPVFLKTGISETEAQEIQRLVKDAGGIVTIK